MSHHTPVMSPEGTPLTDRSVGELVTERPGRSRIFQKHGIDFCCQGGKTLRTACENKEIPLDSVIAELEEEAAIGPVEENNPAELSPHDLADYIVEKHHGFLKDELPRLHAMSDRVAQVHGGHTASLIELNQVFIALERELVDHMHKEENILFPAISAMSRDGAAPMPLDGPIAVMKHEHEEAEAHLQRIRDLTDTHTPPSDACNTYRALFAGLADLDADLHRHIHLENHVLFPAAEKLFQGAN